jgi:cullin 3
MTVQRVADANTLETWERLKKAILEIQNENTSRLSFEENYRYAYNLVDWKHGRMLYEGVLRLIAEHLARLTNEIIAPAFPSGNINDPITRVQQGEMLVKAVRTVWDKHNSSMRKLVDILKYMVS